MRRRWGIEETVGEMIQRRRLEWLGHVVRMPDYRTPKAMLFGWLTHLVHEEAQEGDGGMLSGET